MLEIDEYLRVLLPVVPEEHPSHVRHPVREAFDARELARPAAPTSHRGANARPVVSSVPDG
jgi:hypothetical protein